MDKIAVLIPCYNEAATIAKVVGDFRRVLPEAVVYVYDNNSVDGSDKLAAEAGAVVRYERRQGKGNVVRTMFREIDALCYIMVDADDTYPAEDARKMADEVLSGKADMVIGDRLSSSYFTENKRRFHNSGNKLVRVLVNRIFHGNIRDIMTGYRAFGRLFVKSYAVLSEGFEVETELTIHALRHNFYMVNVPVQYRDRADGSVSKLNTFSDGIKVLRTIFRMFRIYRPFTFFSIVAAILFLIGAAFFIPVFVDYLKTGLVERFPTLIVSMGVFLSALLCFFCGLILSTITKKERRTYELWLNLLYMNGQSSPEDPDKKE